jgi:hypothetical protein
MPADDHDGDDAMARPTKHPDEKRLASIRADLTQAEKIFVQEQAAVAGMSEAEYTRPRHIFERQANDNQPAAACLRDEQRLKDKAIGRKQRASKQRHQEARKGIAIEHKQRLATVRLDTRRGITIARQKVQDQFQPARLAQQRRHEVELTQFKDREENFLGRMTNRLDAIPFKELVQGKAKLSALTEGFKSLASAGARLEQLKRRHRHEERQILIKQRAGEAVEIRRHRVEEKEAKQTANELFKVKRAELQLNVRMDGAAIRAAWRERRSDRATAWDTYGRENPKQSAKEPATLSEEMRKASLQDMLDEMRSRKRPKEKEKDRDRD